MSSNRRTRVSLRSRMTSTEIQFAFMLVDICRMEMALGDLSKADRALMEARAIGEVVATTVENRGGVRTSVRANLLKLAKELEVAEQTLSEVRKAIAPERIQEQSVGAVASSCEPISMLRAAAAGGSSAA
jgi:hypothetical protein